ncbi:acyl-CoA thioesterase [Aliiroseovarius crassostreae]|uniref:acyl-CoA thioesterase n=1 Tax=Aliiroseovarius crassostreae TaxID=154981 RepID=UPI00220EC6F7|nr:acyl-CoA thioesterase [Aliiroseovarius crassostreae]UWQ11688.1 acyl-CoA thioesterase [Aliiroseovarius crassostreae]
MPMIETFRRIVDPSDCDMLGHMNISRYFACVSDAGLGLMTAFGLGQDQIIGGRRQAFAVVHFDTNFHKEVRPGEWIFIRSGITEIGRRSATFHHQMFRATDETLLFDATAKAVLMDLERRKATVIDAPLAQNMHPYLIDHGQVA